MHHTRAGAQRAPALVRLLAPLALAVLIVVAWIIATASGSVNELVLPSPRDVLDTALEGLVNGSFGPYVLETLREALLGVLIGFVIAVPLAYLLTESGLARATLLPYVLVSQSIPLVALAPLLVVWIGYGLLSIAILCAILTFFPMVTTAYLGFAHLDDEVIGAARLDGAGRARLLADIQLPLAAPSILAGLRAGVAMSVTGAIVGEFVMGGSGLGALLGSMQSTGGTAGLFAVIGIIVATTLLLIGSIALIEVLVRRRVST